jgi:formate dehydrogenase subunit delta
MKNDDMIRMVNQIGQFFKNYGPEEGTKEIATHINNFWEPRMRNQLLAYVAEGGKDISEVVLAAMPQVRKPKED